MSTIRDWLRELPKRKPHIEFVTALLTVPVLLTVLVANILSLRNKDKNTAPAPTPSLQKIIIQEPTAKATRESALVNPSPASSCKKEVGPISITSPLENETIKDNPICFVIKYEDPNYCSVVWSYRINGGQWSDYSANSVCLYDVPSGNVQFELRIQSTVSQDQQSLKRNFKYQGNITPTPPLPTPKPSQ